MLPVDALREVEEGTPGDGGWKAEEDADEPDDDILENSNTSVEVEIRSYIYSWSAPLTWVGRPFAGKQCRCGPKEPMECWQKPLLQNFLLTWTELCTEFHFPIHAGVTGVAGIMGSTVHEGEVWYSGYKAISLHTGVAIRVSLVPMSLVVALEGTLEVESEHIRSTGSLLRYFFTHMLGKEVAPWKDKTKKTLEYVNAVERRLHDLDSTFGEAVSHCVSCKSRWKILNAERFDTLRTSLAIKVSDAVQARAEYLMSSVFRVAQEMGFKHRETLTGSNVSEGTVDLLWMRRRASFLIGEMRKQYGMHVPLSWKLGMFFGKWSSSRPRRVVELLVDTFVAMQKLEMSKTAESLSRLVIHELFDSSWAHKAGYHQYICDRAPLRDMSELSECPQGGYSCYPVMHDGRTVEEHASNPSELEDTLSSSGKFTSAGNTLVLDSRPKLFCSLLEGYGYLQSGTGNGMNLTVDDLAAQHWYAEGDLYKGLRHDLQMPRQALLMLPSIFALLRQLQLTTEEGGLLEVQEVEHGDDTATLIEKAEMQWNSFVQATKVVQVSLGRFEDAISVMNEDTQTLVDTDWLRGGDCRATPKTNASIDGCANTSVWGEMLDLMTPERIREKFEEDIERKLAETDIIQEETEFTWIWNGEVTVFFQGVSLESWELCTPDYSQIQLSWSPIYIQTIEALKTATGRIKTSPQHDVVRADTFRAAFYPFGTSRLGFIANLFLRVSSNYEEEDYSMKETFGRGHSIEEVENHALQKLEKDEKHEKKDDDDTDAGEADDSVEIKEEGDEVEVIFNKRVRVRWGTSLTLEIGLCSYSGTAALVTYIATLVAEVLITSIKPLLVDKIPPTEQWPASKRDSSKRKKFLDFVVGSGRAILHALVANPFTTAYVAGAIFMRFGGLRGELRLFIDLSLPTVHLHMFDETMPFVISMGIGIIHIIGKEWELVKETAEHFDGFVPIATLNALNGLVFDISGFLMLAACPSDGIPRLASLNKTSSGNVTELLEPIDEENFETNVSEPVEELSTTRRRRSFFKRLWSRREATAQSGPVR